MHGREATRRPDRGETPRGGNLSVPIQWRRVIRQGDSRACPWSYPRRVFLSSTSTARRRGAERPASPTLLDVAVAVAALAGSLALLRHGGVVPARPGSRQLDQVGVVLAACSTVPLIAWRRSPPGVLTLTAA